ncbi:hypothetical protein ECANGB1_2094 [Enterospora canceri]|uniref:Uncharacterized protein n=1 Tax=Enterospora canceri TaxID=1081671 RepID=A0A1Y1S8U6_9MICR|nr:hypothetical protein ECANGB1_2094 [Enterospora canceri]
MRLLDLINDLSRNPQVIYEIEKEINSLANGSIEGVYSLASQIDPSNSVATFYLFKIVETKIRQNKAYNETAQFIEGYLNRAVGSGNPVRPCVIDSYVLLALHCWPTLLTNFIPVIHGALSSQATASFGLRLLHAFLTEINYSTEIDQKRRSELKKAVSTLDGLGEVVDRSTDSEDVRLAIRIKKELLTMAPKLINFDLVYKEAPSHPNEAVEFFVEAGKSGTDEERLIGLLEHFQPDLNLIDAFFTRANTDQRVMKYMFRGIGESETMVQSLGYWARVLGNEGVPGSVVTGVLEEALTKVKEIEEDEAQEAETALFQVLSAASRSHPATVLGYLVQAESKTESRFVTSCLYKIHKTNPAILADSSFSGAYLNSYACYLMDDPRCVGLLEQLDYGDKEQTRTAVNVVERFYGRTADKAPFGRLYALVCDHLSHSFNYEILAAIDSRLGRHVSIEFNSPSSAIRYFFYLKADSSHYSQYKEAYLSYFAANCPFDRCFAILSRLGLDEFESRRILEFVFDQFQTYPFSDICCMNTDLIGRHPEVADYFIQKEVAHFVEEYDGVRDYKEYYLAARGLLGLMETRLRVSPATFWLLFDLLYIDYAPVVNRILLIVNQEFNRASSAKSGESHPEMGNESNLDRAVYSLMTCYSLPHMLPAQGQIATALAWLLIRAPGSFVRVLRVDSDQVESIRSQIRNMDRRGGVGVVKSYLARYRGRQLHRMYENESKVKEYKIFGKEKSRGDITDIPDLNG